MDSKKGKEIIINRSNAFHDRYFKAYGQLILKVDDSTYLMSRENLMIQEIKSEEDIDLYDIRTGDVGAIFRARKDVNAIVFACTKAAVAYAQDNVEMIPALDDLAQIVGPTVKVASGQNVKETINALSGRHGCFVKGGGIIAVGRDMEEAIAAARILEKSAEAEIYGQKLGGLKYLSRIDIERMHSYYDKSYYHINDEHHVELLNYDEEEFRLRNALIETGKKMCWDDLTQGTWGNLSVRLNDDEMLVTPSGMDYFSMQIEDIVIVDIDTLEYDEPQRVPTSECRLHAAIYRAHPDTGAVIHTHSNGCSVFAAAHAGFKIGTLELRAVVGDVGITDYAAPGTRECCDNVLSELKDSHACIIANHGAIFHGRDLEVVLAIANAVETRACNLLGIGEIDMESSEEE